MRTTRDSIADVWGAGAAFAGPGQWAERTDERTAEEPDRWVKSVCVLCSTCCGLEIGVKNGQMVRCSRRPARPSQPVDDWGQRGLHGWEANHSADRLTRPLIRKGAELTPASWDEALPAPDVSLAQAA